MLGKLARWLRILGYDTSYSSCIADDNLIELCLEDDRVLLTSDRPLSERDEGFQRFFIESNQLEAQVAQLVRDISLDLDRETFTRCLLCNTSIETIPTENVATEVPPHVLKTHDRFHRCPECNRVYWSGSHHERMTDRLCALREEVAAWVS